MRFVDEFRDAELGRVLAGEIAAAAEPGSHYKLMEVCGGHTHSIYKYGVDDLLPDNVELVHGRVSGVRDPDGPVDDGIAIATRKRHLLLRRHDAGAGAEGAARGQGRRARRADGLLAAGRASNREVNPDRKVVFFAIGFETTAPSTALTLKRAKAEENFLCMCNHVTIVPPLRAFSTRPICASTDFIGPGRVSTIVGARPFEFIPADYGGRSSPPGSSRSTSSRRS